MSANSEHATDHDTSADGSTEPPPPAADSYNSNTEPSFVSEHGKLGSHKPESAFSLPTDHFSEDTGKTRHDPDGISSSLKPTSNPSARNTGSVADLQSVTHWENDTRNRFASALNAAIGRSFPPSLQGAALEALDDGLLCRAMEIEFSPNGNGVAFAIMAIKNRIKKQD